MNNYPDELAIRIAELLEIHLQHPPPHEAFKTQPCLFLANVVIQEIGRFDIEYSEREGLPDNGRFLADARMIKTLQLQLRTQERINRNLIHRVKSESVGKDER